MRMNHVLSSVLAGVAVLCGFGTEVMAETPVSVYGAWHCGSDFCTWASVRNMTEFDQKNHWLIDRGNGQPSVNLVILSFVHPLRLLNKTTDAQTAQGVPVGMHAAEVAQNLGVGIEIDYEENASPNLAGLQAFIDAYRSVLPYGTSLTSSTGSFVTSVAPAPNGAGT